MNRPSTLASGTIGVAVTVALLARPATALFFDEGPSTIVYPRPSLPLRFDHRYHVKGRFLDDDGTPQEGEGLSCTFCHEQVEESQKSSDADIPGHDSCDSCHASWIETDDGKAAPPEACARCHVAADARGDGDPAVSAPKWRPVEVPAPNLHFSHARHVGADLACTDCHAQVPDRALATPNDFPTMDRCIDCHQARGVSTRCASCHLSDGPRLQTRFGKASLKPVRSHLFALHDAGFLRAHGAAAHQDRAYCENCHSESDCQSCHDGIGRDTRYHPGDWLGMHALRSKKDDVRCQSCHRHQSFCLNCHVQSGVASTGPTTGGLTRRTIRQDAGGQVTGPHPVGPEWIRRGSRNFHGFLAQRNIRACASCHQEQFCISCHASNFGGGRRIGGNPHGPDAARLRGSRAARQNARACLKCHHPDDPSWR